jgi:large subunit ribosomal protein L14
MKGVATNVSRTLVPGSMLVCADNSGAYTLRVINKVGKAGSKGRLSKSGIGDIVAASVRSGNPQYVKKIVRVVIIRQKQPIRRADGMRVRFEDNAGILINEVNLPIGRTVKGPMAREVIMRYAKIANVASRVI